MSPPTVYYTDDITLLSAPAIWRCVAPGGLFAPLLFARFYFRKLLRWPYPATYGASYPNALPVQAIEELPPEARNAFAQTFPEFNANGLKLAFCTVTPFIGTKWGASAIFLHEEGEIYASVVWIRIQLGALDRAEMAIACHSLLESGLTLTTAAMRQNRWIPEMIPSSVSITRLPETTTLTDLLRTHRETLRTKGAAPKRIDENTLQSQILTTMQALYDHLIGKRLYRKLSEAEVKRLMNHISK